ncbi:RNA helicase, putative [Plasmodium gallinaceum]|uniref:RNA helicase n=1 Tax=Plasmodium gallinaceum TaxID=5849 RepID=A0A1J1GZF8_PLAGA|nr:RNA helicase, putative [Plasmodium gallinaceum]CRG97679.1 RNA helicase, putative [Plasmodium gallinaceum]
MNYNNNNINTNLNKNEDQRNNYLRNNYIPNINDASYRDNIKIDENSSANVFTQMRSKRDPDSNITTTNREYYENNINKNSYINDNIRNMDNNKNYINYIDKNNIGSPENYKNKYTSSYYEKQNNENNFIHQQKKGGNFMSNINKNKYENGIVPNNQRNNNNNNSQEKPRYKPPMLRNQNMYNRNNMNRMNYNKGANPIYNRNYNIPKTAWANRDNRRYYAEKEEEIFSNVRSEKGVNFELYNSIPIELSGHSSENILPIEKFDDPALNLSDLLLSNIKKVNYDKTTPIQKYSLSIIMNKNDLIGVAQTGSGKTAGYLLPIINHMLLNDPPKHTFYDDNNNNNSNYYFNKVCLPICLILAPTRELAVQIFYDAKKFCYETGIRPVVLYGGNNIKTQLSNLDKGADIIVATPGRLNDILEKKKIRLFLTSFLVLDEADRMLDMGFSPQIRSIINDYDMPGNDNDADTNENRLEYKKYCNEVIKRQTIMFSATFRKEIQVLAKEYLCNYTYLLVGKVGSTHEYIKQNLVYVEEENKCNYLINILSENNNGLTIIFVETKRKADIIERYLNNKKLNAVCIHGDKSQDERERALKLFKRGIKNILVATDVAARGLDISNIKHVINFDLPSNIDDYIHRIGRTGRAGNIGIATSFVNDDNKNIFKDLLATLEECNQFIPHWFFNLVMRYTASARANRNYKYKSIKNKNNYSRYTNNNNTMANKNMNSNPFNNNNAYNNSAYNNNGYNNGGGFSSNPYNNLYANNYNNNPYNNSSNNNNLFNNNKYNNNYNQKKFEEPTFHRNNYHNTDDNNDEW